MTRYTLATDFNVDPTGVLNSTAGMQAAIDAASNTGHLVFPRGSYLYDGGLQITFPIRITWEDGAKWVDAPSTYALPTRLNAANVPSIRLDNPTLVGNGNIAQGVPGSEPAAIYFYKCDDAIITEPNIRGVKGIAIALPHCSEAKVRSGKIKNVGRDVRVASVPYRLGGSIGPPTFVATPAVYMSGGRNCRVQDVSFEKCEFSAVFLFCIFSEVINCSASEIGESAFYCENINPATNNGIEVRENSFFGNKVIGTSIRDISACGFEVTAHDSTISGNRISGAGTHGVGTGLANRITVEGNNIGSCNQARATMGDGICVSVYSGCHNVASQQGDMIILNGNQIYDEMSKMTSGIRLYSKGEPGYSIRGYVNLGNPVRGIPIPHLVQAPLG